MGGTPLRRGESSCTFWPIDAETASAVTTLDCGGGFSRIVLRGGFLDMVCAGPGISCGGAQGSLLTAIAAAGAAGMLVRPQRPHRQREPGGEERLRYDADFARAQIMGAGGGRASEIIEWARGQGWTSTQTKKWADEVSRPKRNRGATLKRGSTRAPGSGSPHVELRDAEGKRIDPYGNEVTRKSLGNHTPIVWDLP